MCNEAPLPGLTPRYGLARVGRARGQPCQGWDTLVPGSVRVDSPLLCPLVRLLRQDPSCVLRSDTRFSRQLWPSGRPGPVASARGSSQAILGGQMFQNLAFAETGGTRAAGSTSRRELGPGAGALEGGKFRLF